MGLLDWLTKRGDPQVRAAKEATAKRQAEMQIALRADHVPPLVGIRLEDARTGKLPWVATMSPAELLITRSHGIRPIASVSATCWMHYGYSWTDGHAQGWETALRRLREEAKAAGANAVVDVKMRTVSIELADSMDFTLIGTAVKVDGLPPSTDPIVATVPALEFVKLLEADVVPTGIAIGAHFEWISDWRRGPALRWMGNIECQPLSQLWETVRRNAHSMLQQNARGKGNGVLAHVNFSQMFEREQDNSPNQYLARHIVVATTVDAKKENLDVDLKSLPPELRRRLAKITEYRGSPVPHTFQMAVDLHAGRTPLVGTTPHHQSYNFNDYDEGAI